MTSRCPCQLAQQKAVVPSIVLASTLAPFSTKYWTTPSLPFLAAQCSAVRPRNDRFPCCPASGQHEQLSMRCFTTRRWPDPAAQWRHVLPCPSVSRAGSNPVSRMARIRSSSSPLRACSKGSLAGPGSRCSRAASGGLGHSGVRGSMCGS